MKYASTLFAWAVAALVAALVALNWSTLMVSAPLNLVVAQIEAPLGIVMLGVSGVLLALFFVAYLRHQIGSMLEARRLMKEIQRAQDLADKAESSRVENLHHLIATEFRLLNERLNTLATSTSTSTSTTPVSAEFKPLSMTEIVTGHERV